MNEDFGCLKITKPIYVRAIPPIDFWNGCPEVDGYERDIILQLMPEETRNYTVYKTFIPVPGGCSMAPAYMVKADNNGTIYVFSNHKLVLDDCYANEHWADYSLVLQKQK